MPFRLPSPSLYTIPLPADITDARNAFQSALENCHRVAESHVQRSLHTLLMLVWQRPWHVTEENPIPDPLERFLALLSLREDGGHADP